MSTEQDLDELFRAERAVRPAVTAIDQGWQRLAVDLAANVVPAPVATGALKLASTLVPKWLLIGFTVGLAGFGASAALDAPKARSARSQPLAATAPQRAARAPLLSAVSPPVQMAPPALSISPSSPSTPPSVSAPLGVSAPSGVSTPSAPTDGNAPSAATFDAELKLISFAKGELDAHRFAQARAWLAEHAERFPNGVFAVEREALGVLAACEQGPKNEALVRAFATRHPGSPVIERLARACRASDFSKSSNGGVAPAEPTIEPGGENGK